MQADRLSLHAAAAAAPEHPWLVTDEGHWSLARVATAVDAARGWLAAQGLADAEPIGIAAAPVPASVLWILAAIEDGRPFVPLHPRLTPAETAAVLSDAGIRLVVPGVLPSPGAGQPAKPPAAIDPERPLAVVYTSGTSGRAKGAVLSRRAFLASAEASRANLGHRDHDRWLLALPPAHVGGLAIVVRALVDRSAVVLWGPGRFDPAQLAECTHRHSVTLASLVPTMLHRLLAAAVPLAPSVRAVLLGGAPAAPGLLAAAATRDIPVLTTYGLTEACSQVTTQPYGTIQRGEAGAGRPVAGAEVRIRDGRILVRGPMLFSGYHPLAASPRPVDDDGYFDTGDHGFFDAQGNLHVQGRHDDLIIAGGENVHPLEIERVALDVPGVADACAFGVPDPEWGQRVALVVVATGTAPPPFSAIVSALGERLARHKLPSLGAWVPALPYRGIGKLDRRAAAAAHTPALRPIERPRA